jgi:hypothetical protein
MKLNTSFVERLNLTIRQGSAYLGRRTICQARWKERLEDHLELFRCAITTSSGLIEHSNSVVRLRRLCRLGWPTVR